MLSEERHVEQAPISIFHLIYLLNLISHQISFKVTDEAKLYLKILENSLSNMEFVQFFLMFLSPSPNQTLLEASTNCWLVS